MAEISPAVERARASAEQAAADRGDAARLGDWLLALIEEDWGKPAELVGRFHGDRDNFRETIQGLLLATPIAADAVPLFKRARELALAFRGEPTLTTEFLMIAVIDSDGDFQQRVVEAGLRYEELLAALRGEQPTAPEVECSKIEFVVADRPELAEAARALDANLNRARESLRVLDDYCRFVRNEAFLAGRFKELRHRLAAAVETLPIRKLLESRDTRNDVGTTTTAGREYERTNTRQVAEVNSKRLQESLRSLEEFGKVISESFAGLVEAIRYETYTLEKSLLHRCAFAKKLESAKLYVLLTASQCTASLDWTIAEAASGGAGIFQMREKNSSDREWLDRARQMRTWTQKANALFIINDRPDIAKLSEADGVHLGQDDLSVADARRILGSDKIVGVSTHNLDQLRTAILDGADYVGLGPTFPSTTKPFDGFSGLTYLRQTAKESQIPAFALGGITIQNVREVSATGIRRIAVSAAIAQAEDPEATAMAFCQILNSVS